MCVEESNVPRIVRNSSKILNSSSVDIYEYEYVLLLINCILVNTKKDLIIN